MAYLILNRFDYDSRARMEVETIANMGHRVEIIATTGADSGDFIGCPIHRIPQRTWPWRKIRFIQYNLKAAIIGRRLKAEVYHAVDLDTLQAAVWAAGRVGGKVIYEARELYTELETLLGRELVRRFWRSLETRLIRKAARVITINQSIAKELSRRYGIARPQVVRNVAKLSPVGKAVNLHALFSIPEDWKILVYQGILRRGQGLLYILEIMKSLEHVALVLVGEGPIEDEIRAKAEQLELAERVKFAGMVPPDKLAEYTAGADAGLLLMEGVALNNRLALPQKLFQYLNAGIPQIVSPMPEIAGFVQAERTGVVVPMDDSYQASRKVSDLLADAAKYDAVRANCMKSARANNWETESLKLTETYKELEQL